MDTLITLRLDHLSDLWQEAEQHHLVHGVRPQPPPG